MVWSEVDRLDSNQLFIVQLVYPEILTFLSILVSEKSKFEKDQAPKKQLKTT